MNKDYEQWKAKKLAEDPDYFKKRYQIYLARYGRDYLNKASAKWRHSPEGIAYHAKYTSEYMHSHPEIMEARRRVVEAKYYGEFSMAEFCEVCPEDDIQKATATHHPDYNYPQIIVSCCVVCHVFLNKQRTKQDARGKQE